jgi:hypothetical protein
MAWRMSPRSVNDANGSNSEVRARHWAVRFTLKNRRRQSGLSGPKSARSRRRSRGDIHHLYSRAHGTFAASAQNKGLRWVSARPLPSIAMG